MSLKTVYQFLNKRPVIHLVFWILFVSIGSFIFSYQQNFPYSFFLLNFLVHLPVVICFTYGVVYYLVPAILLKRKYWKFFLLLIIGAGLAALLRILISRYVYYGLSRLGLNYSVDKNAGFWAVNKYSTSLTCTTLNFVLADVFAAQLQYAIETKVLMKTNGIYSNNKAVGKYLIENLFRYGNLLPWDKVIERATGEPLNSTYFVNQLIGDEDVLKN